MDFITEQLQQFGYPVLFVLGLLELLGAPVATTAVLLAVGAAALEGAIHPLIAILAAAAGGLVGECTWFGLARWRGERLLDITRGLASNPNECVLGFHIVTACSKTEGEHCS